MFGFLLLAHLLADAPVSSDGAVLIRLGGRVAPADDAAKPATPIWRGAPISLDFADADIANVLRAIGDVAKLNFVLADGVSGKVTVRMEDVPWDEALAAILTAKGLAAVPLGAKIVVVQPKGAAP